MLFAAVILAAVTAPAFAGTINFAATYTTQSGYGCSISCISTPPQFLPGPFTGQFSLTSSQLGVDGSYDVSASLLSAFFRSEPGATSSLTALAIVTGGKVSDVTIDFTENFPVPVFSSTETITYTASGGSFMDSTVVSGVLSLTNRGVYSIAELPPAPIPEPASAGSLAIGLGLMISAWLFNWRRKRNTGV